jgi:hypothetical protein
VHLSSLERLYCKQEKFDAAEKQVLFVWANLITDSLIYDHLGNVCTSHGRSAEAWTACALSRNFNRNKNVKNKLDFMQAEILQEELSRLMLPRSENNYTKVFSFKTCYKIKFKVLSKKFIFLSLIQKMVMLK